MLKIFMTKKRKEEIKQKRNKAYTEMFKLYMQNLIDGDKGWKSRYDYNYLLEDIKKYLEGFEQDTISYEDVYKIFILDVANTNYPMEIKQQLLNEIRKDLFPPVSEDKEIQAEKTSIEYIMEYPERIITDITKENYRNKKELSIYDLNKEELKAYKKSMENLIKKAEKNLNSKNDSSELTKEIKILTFEEWFKNQR
ncbi:hypothetical protein HDR59_05340 [bacterium]|nr:hypothetical protein [bacterium]